jgi:hypothetical protein
VTVPGLRSVVSLFETVRPQCDLRIPAAHVLASLNPVDGINWDTK